MIGPIQIFLTLMIFNFVRCHDLNSGHVKITGARSRNLPLSRDSVNIKIDLAYLASNCSIAKKFRSLPENSDDYYANSDFFLFPRYL